MEGQKKLVELYLQDGLNFKDGRPLERLLLLHPVALIVLFDMFYYCKIHNMPFCVSDTATTLEEDQAIERKEKTHREFRSFDLSVKGWSRGNISTFVGHFNQKYEHLAAISSKTKKPLLADCHGGTALHIHVQIHSRYNFKKS
jgi:hypothetical protein